MDVSAARRVVRAANEWMGAQQADLLIRPAGRDSYERVSIVGEPDSDDDEAIGEIPTHLLGASRSDLGVIREREVLVPFATSGGDDIGLYLRFPGPVGEAQQRWLHLLKESLSPVFEEQARSRAFAQEMESVMRILTHDLKSPTNAIAGFVDILFEDFGSVIPESARELLARVRSSARRLQILLDGVYRLRHATFRDPHGVPCDLARIVREAYARVRDRYPDVACAFELSPSLPADLVADPEKLDLALGSIFDNAFKFREKSRALRIDVGYLPQGARRHALVSTDTSMGFEERFAAAVLEPFRKLHPPGDYPGAGVGLAVARTCLAQHGGEIRLTSAPSEGVKAVLVFGELERAPSPERP